MYKSLSFARSLCVLFFTVLCVRASFSQDLTDHAIKKNISPITGSLASILSLQPKSFEYNTAQYNHLKLPEGRRFGFVSEEFQLVFPGLVYKKPVSFMSGKNSYRQATLKTIDIESLIPLLIASIQEQQVQIERLKTEIDDLRKNVKM
jgi:Chaperone of endosialidase